MYNNNISLTLNEKKFVNNKTKDYFYSTAPSRRNVKNICYIFPQINSIVAMTFNKVTNVFSYKTNIS